MRRKYRKKFKPRHINPMLGFYDVLERLDLCSPNAKAKATDRIVDLATSNIR